MPVFLLRNVNERASVDGLVQSLAREVQADVVLLVEYDFGASELPGLLMADGLIRRPSPRRFGVFAREDHRMKRLRYGVGNHVGMWTWVPPSGREGLIVLVHAPDRRNYDDSTRRVFFRRVADAVRRHEASRDHRRTIIAGDFNAQPFESAIADSDGLHAIGVLSKRQGASREVHGAGAATDFFYNPMWRAYGHQAHPDAGAATHHWARSWAHELGWFMLDQGVLRPGEAARFPEDRLRIVTQVGKISLLDLQGLPDSRTASDHLPVVFHWDL